jgi:antitoxin component HigA of HigAB toxin-antitoxin module
MYHMNKEENKDQPANQQPDPVKLLKLLLEMTAQNNAMLQVVLSNQAAIMRNLYLGGESQDLANEFTRATNALTDEIIARLNKQVRS